jgi:hypothetical protein
MLNAFVSTEQGSFEVNNAVVSIVDEGSLRTRERAESPPRGAPGYSSTSSSIVLGTRDSAKPG